MSSYNIFTGDHWYDYTRPKPEQWSITFGSTGGLAIIAALSLVVSTFISGWVWSLVSLFVYCLNKNSQDSVIVQHRLVWRNNPSPWAAWKAHFTIYRSRLSLREILRKCISFPCRKIAQLCRIRVFEDHEQNAIPDHFPRLLSRSAWTVILPLTIFCAFVVAGNFVSRVARPSGDVLIAKDLSKCGLWNFTAANESRNEQSDQYSRKVLNDTIVARNYARSCYPKHDILNTVSVCNTYTRGDLKYGFAEVANVCPFVDYPTQSFDQGPCNATNNHGSFNLISDLLDSSIDLGINADAQDAIKFQKNVTCSILNWESRHGESSGLSTMSNVTYTTYLFGSIKVFDNVFDSEDVTYFYNPQTPSDIVPFQVTAFYSNAYENDTAWVPAHPFNIEDGDVSIFFFAANSVHYTSPVYDPFFLATNNGSGYFTPNNPVTIMGCVDRYKICKDATTCTENRGLVETTQAVQHLDLNAAQDVTSKRILILFKNSDTYSSVYGTGTAALQASDTVLDLNSFGLPPNQWQLEAETWFQTSLAKMQAYAIEYVQNTAQFDHGGVLAFPDANETTLPVWQAQCGSQRVRNPGQFLTFYLWAVVAILVLVAVLYIASKVSKCVVASLHDPTYVADDLQQLGRMARHANVVNGALLRACEDGIPIYRDGAQLEGASWSKEGDEADKPQWAHAMVEYPARNRRDAQDPNNTDAQNHRDSQGSGQDHGPLSPPDSHSSSGSGSHEPQHPSENFQAVSGPQQEPSEDEEGVDCNEAAPAIPAESGIELQQMTRHQRPSVVESSL